MNVFYRLALSYKQKYKQQFEKVQVVIYAENPQIKKAVSSLFWFLVR
jgi:hypothetical protein